ncbi:MAG TPA: succinylglutamate desuccinylase/aspartoacylase family protein, partial [Gemmataceae bacterium]
MNTSVAARAWAAALAVCLQTASVWVETKFTGDKVQGVPVISQLNVADLEAGKTHRFMFQGVETGAGQHWYCPVVVVKGAKDGKKVLLAAGVHGDEASPVRVVQKTLAGLNPANMSGTVVGVFDLSRPAKEFVQRRWPTNETGGNLVDFNRVWPGNESGNPPARHAWLLWNRLFKNNVDVALDFHTAATSSDFTLFIFADLRKPENQRLAELFPAEQIKDDPGLSGTLETAFVEAGIPAVTIEVGGPRRLDLPKIRACVEGARNVLVDYRVLDEKVGRTAKDSKAFLGNKLEEIRATTGGFVELHVKLGEKVTPGQKVAVQFNSFGDVVQEYSAGVEGEVAILGTDALRDPGARLV